MADDTPTPGTANDITVITSPPKTSGLSALADYQSNLYRQVLVSQQYSKQHRTVLASLATINDLNELPAYSDTAAASYNQAQIQLLMNQVSAATQVLAQINVTLAFLKQTATDTVVKLE
jgi:hypothetical protein